MRNSYFPTTHDKLDALEERYARAEEGEDSDSGDDAFPTMRDMTFDNEEYADNDFHIANVKNDEVEDVLGYAETGSDIPEGFWGIHWLDQFHASSIAKDPGWLAQVPIRHCPSQETVVCFGDEPTQWNPATNSIDHIAAYGGEKGHWTMTDDAMGQVQMNNAIMTRMSGSMQFLNPDLVKVDAKIKVPELDMWIHVPDSMFKMEMHKTGWGWNRVTTLGPDLPNFIDHSAFMTKVMPEYFMQLVQVGEQGAMQYPVLQIIDGDGNRTQYYDEYLEFINTQCSHQVFGKVGDAPFCSSCVLN